MPLRRKTPPPPSCHCEERIMLVLHCTEDKPSYSPEEIKHVKVCYVDLCGMCIKRMAFKRKRIKSTKEWRDNYTIVSGPMERLA